MAIRQYLAMTASEIAANSPLPPQIAWMACHFSPYGTGLTNLPHRLAPESLLILNDRTPIHLHDPLRIACQLNSLLERFSCAGLLLDFQRPGCGETGRLCAFLSDTLPFPVVVSSLYARYTDSPVFLPSPPCHIPLEKYIAPWRGREIWLELALDCQELLLTPQGCQVHSIPRQEVSDSFHADERLHCRYRSQVTPSEAKFTLLRTRENLAGLVSHAEKLGVTTTVGLYQELHGQ